MVSVSFILFGLHNKDNCLLHGYEFREIYRMANIPIIRIMKPDIKKTNPMILPFSLTGALLSSKLIVCVFSDRKSGFEPMMLINKIKKDILRLYSQVFSLP